tara:strand:+ start:460 stop:675 length:216 start_codon:yes stop_codon:yes gene_type:complete
MKKDRDKSLIQFCNLQLSLLIKEEMYLRQSVQNIQIQRKYLKEILRELTGQETKALPGEEELDNILRFPDK